MRSSKLICLSLVTAIFMAACGDTQANETEQVGDPKLGEPLYAQNCASCHGADLKGTDLGPSHLSIVYEPNHHGDNAFRSAVANGAPQHHWGFGDMLPVSGLSASEVDSIIAYVRKQQRTWGFD